VETRKTFLASASVSFLCRREALEYSEHGGNNNSRVFSDCILLARNFGRRRLGERIYTVRSPSATSQNRTIESREINDGATITLCLQSEIRRFLIFQISRKTTFRRFRLWFGKILSAAEQGER